MTRLSLGEIPLTRGFIFVSRIDRRLRLGNSTYARVYLFIEVGISRLLLSLKCV